MNSLRIPHRPACLLALAASFALPALAEDAPLSYQASPDKYQLLGENEDFRVILQTVHAGERDAWHSHSALALYRMSDCTSRTYAPDGKHREAHRTRGEVAFQKPIPSHSFENVGKTDCVALIVERK